MDKFSHLIDSLATFCHGGTRSWNQELEPGAGTRSWAAVPLDCTSASPSSPPQISYFLV